MECKIKILIKPIKITTLPLKKRSKIKDFLKYYLMEISTMRNCRVQDLQVAAKIAQNYF